MLTTRAVRLLRRRFFINGEPAGVLAQRLPAIMFARLRRVCESRYFGANE
jgi:hypothetical protein